MAIQRPGRPTTRAVPPAAAPAPAKPAARPATGPVKTQKSPTGRVERAQTRTGRVEQKSTRSVPTRPAAPKSNTALIGGIVGGVVVVAIIAAVAMGGGSEKAATSTPKETSKPKAVNVGDLERNGMAKCDEGYGIIKKCEAQIQSASLSDSERAHLKGELEKATGLLRDGMAMLDEANRKSGNTYPITQYIEAKKIARMKLGELGGK